MNKAAFIDRAYNDGEWQQRVFQWHQSPDARKLLALINHDELQSDKYLGQQNGTNIAKAFSDRADDTRAELEAMRDEALDKCADLTGQPQHSDIWEEAREDAAEDAITVAEAVRRAINGCIVEGDLS